MNHSGFILQSASLLDTVVRLGNVCQQSYSIEPNCITARKLGPIVEKYLSAFHSESEEPRIHMICRSSQLLLDEISENRALPLFVSKALAKHYSVGLKKNYDEFQFEAVNKYINSFEEIVNLEADHISSVIADQQFSKQKLMAHYSTDIRFALTIMSSYSICLRAPESYKNGDFEKWRTKFMLAEATLSSTEKDVKELSKQEIESNDLTIFRYFLWPYIFIAALALKFGKGISSLRPY